MLTHFPNQPNPCPKFAQAQDAMGKRGRETLTSRDRWYSSISSMYGATAACAAPASGRFGSRRRPTSAVPSSSRRFLASSASASARAADRVLGFDARGAEASSASGALFGSSARALRFPGGLLGGRGCGRAARAAAFSFVPIAFDPMLQLMAVVWRGFCAGILEGFGGDGGEGEGVRLGGNLNFELTIMAVV